MHIVKTTTMEILTKISAFLNRYRWAITLSLFVCCISQQCAISSLRNEIAFLRDKYEAPAANESLSDDVSSDEVVNIAAENTSAGNETAESNSNHNTLTICIIAIVLIGAWLFVAWRRSLFPFNARISGKIWQDFSGRIVYTLTINNHGRADANIDNAMIEFININDRRKFRMPVTDFPLMLTKGTKHSVNVSLQRLFEQNPDLTNFKMIRVSVDINGKRQNTLPLGIRFKTA